MITKVESGQLRRHDLREAYRAKYPDGIGKPTNDATSRAAAEDDDSHKTHATETNITLLLNHHSGWLKSMPQSSSTPERKPWFSGEPFLKYHTYAQFPVVVPTTRQARRIDVLTVENHTTDPREVSLHCIEIKVSPEDLHNDHKYGEYADFVDYMWIAIPNCSRMKEQAKLDVPPQFGIIITDSQSEQVIVLRVAQHHRGPLRENTLMTALIRSI
ncbi:MmcB family DNA repair protein [Lacticaseibacillus casei]|uniref:MmcB family DNA repair protein n=1 Tax=Lacticaseibacillus casei TaxID=1582 RepID=UPI00110998B0|nr:MmcB family DNA repair protein [Lacticaseibacillus casei]TLQ50348.1 MmcB family DNA repair protein [Lacticaseibacillus casei]